MADVVEGIREACLALDVPVISGNVSLYNESEGTAILPTPIVGVIGVLEDVAHHARAAFAEDQTVWLLGPLESSLALSEYASRSGGWTGANVPNLNLDLERRVQACVRELVQRGVVASANDVAEGGLAVTLVEMALASKGGIRYVESRSTVITP